MLCLVQGQNGWRVTYSPTKICEAKGSTVDISCTYTYPSRVNNKDNKVEKRFWFTRTEGHEYIDVETESKYSGRVQNHCEGNRCTLRITDLRESDSAEYKFRIITNQDTYSGSPGVTLSLTDSPKLPSVSVSPSAKIVEGTSVTLTCSSDANPAARFTWDKINRLLTLHRVSSGPELVFRSIQASDSGEYYCTAENELGRKTSTKISVNVEYPPMVPTVSVNPTGEIRENSSVTLTCSSDANPAAKYTWYKENQTLPKERGQTHHFTSISSEDRGTYYCKSENVHGKRRASNESSEAEERPGIREQGKPEEQEDLQYASIHFSNKQTDPDLYYDIRPARPHRHMEQQEDTEYTAVKFNRASTTMRSRVVQGQNGWRVTYSPTKICAAKGSTVDISCTYTYPSRVNNKDNKVEKKFWFTRTEGREFIDVETESKYSGRVQNHCEGNRCTLRITDLRESDSAEYKFRIITNQDTYVNYDGVTLSVTDAPKLPSVSVSPSAKIVKGTSVTLTCSSDANPAARYTWDKSYGPQNSHHVSSGPELVFRSIQASDSGEYYCTAENELGRKTSTKFSVNVEYPPKVPTVSVSPTGEIRENSSVTLTCSSDANPAAKYTWYKENQTLPKERGQTYHFTSISSEDRGTYYCKSENLDSGAEYEDVSDLKAVTAAQTEDTEEQSSQSNCLVVHRSNQSCSFSPADLVQGQNGWRVTYSPTKICAAKGSTVDISCTYTYPSRVNKKDNKVEKKFWFTRTKGHEYIDVETESKYSGRVQNHCERRNRCTLRITDLRESDSAVYMFRIITNQDTYVNYDGVTLSVTDAPKLPSVSVSPSAKIVKGTSVTLTCSSDANPAARYTWDKSYGPQNSHHVSSGPELVFRSIQASDSGEYYCTAENELGRKASTKFSVNVEYPPKVPTVSVSPTGEIRENSSVNLTCSSDANPAANYTWYKENQTLPKERGQTYHFTFISSEDRGTYYCKSENTHQSFPLCQKRRASYELSEAEERPGIREQGQPEEQEDLQYASIHFSNKQTDPDLYYNIRPARPHRHMEQQEDTEYTAVKFNRASTTMSYAAITSKFWFSPERSRLWRFPSSPEDPSEDPQYAGRVQVLETERGRSTLRISDLSESDSAQHHFKFNTPSFEWRSSLPGTSLTVTDALKAPSVVASPSSEIMEGGSVTLTCSSDANPAANYTWYKEHDDSPKTSGQIFTITEFTAEHMVQGQNGWRVTYSPTKICAAKGSTVNISCTYTYPSRVNKKDNRVEKKFWFTRREGDAPKLPSVSVSPSAKIVEGTSVTLTCSSDANPAARYTWYKSYGPRNSHYVSSGPELVFRFIQASDSGEYYCTAENELGRKTSTNISVSVEYPPKVPTVSVSPTGEIRENSSVNLTCSSDANPAAKYTWYKENQTLPKERGQTYHFTSTSSEDRGTYYCKSENLDSGAEYEDVSDLKAVTAAQTEDTEEQSSQPPKKVWPPIKVATATIYCQTHAGMPLEQLLEVVQGQNNWRVTYSPTKICEAKGSTVDISCTYTYPSRVNKKDNKVEKKFWFTRREGREYIDVETESKYSGRVQNHCEGNRCTLRITDLRESDSAVYKFRFITNQDKYFGYNGVTLSVTDAPKLPSVSVSPSAKIVEGTSVTLTCSSEANPAARYTWYKSYGPRNSHHVSSGPELVFRSIQASDSGEYYCTAENELGRKTSTKISVNVEWNSTLIMNIIRLTLVLLLVIPLLLLIVWTRKKTLSFAETIELDSGAEYEDVSDLKAVTAAQTEDTEEQEDTVQMNQRHDSLWRVRM
uniref:basement membrane-specific heparan sulfate proteoglycan core protein-like n=1 Tax=Semicossyphus pulcher TaxID=241346 RepID=UPI0037E93BF7